MKRNMWIFLLVPLALSVFYSGYWYTYYGDELYHVHTVYLIAHGYRPFQDFFTIYSPIFHYLLLPFFAIFGFSLETIQLSKLLMIGIFSLRLAIGYLFLSKLFSKLAGFFFVLFMLLDPFTVFTGMQIRPDNLLMLVFFAGLLTLVRALSKKSFLLFGITGAFMGLSIAVSIKSGVMVGVVSLTLLFYCFKKQLWKPYLYYCAGGVMVGVSFCLVWLGQGTFLSMGEQLILDAKAISDGIWFPTRFGFFYQPNNAFVYGLGGKPVSWYIALCMPLIACAGILYSLMAFRRSVQKQFFVITLTGMLLFQYAFFFTVKSMFVQYYLMINWLLALFAAVFTAALMGCIRQRTGKFIVHMLLLGLFVFISFESIKANLQRPHTISQESQNILMRQRWERIPPESPVYPSLLFRPLSQPIPYGSIILPEIPLSIRNRYPSTLSTFQNLNVEYLILNDYVLQFLDPQALSYIHAHFSKDRSDGELWVRNSP